MLSWGLQKMCYFDEFTSFIGYLSRKFKYWPHYHLLPLKMISKICVVLCLLFQSGFSTLYYEKQCPVVEPIPKFDWKAFAGTWYEQARYDNDYEIKAHCIAVNFSTDNNTFVTTEFIEDTPYTFSGPMNLASNGTGVIFFHSSLYKKIEHTDEIPLTVLAVDMNNYVVLYDCKYDEETKRRHDYLWILSRFKSYGGETKASVDKLLDKTPFVDKSKLIWQDFSPKSCNR